MAKISREMLCTPCGRGVYAFIKRGVHEYFIECGPFMWGVMLRVHYCLRVAFSKFHTGNNIRKDLQQNVVNYNFKLLCYTHTIVIYSIAVTFLGIYFVAHSIRFLGCQFYYFILFCSK